MIKDIQNNLFDRFIKPVPYQRTPVPFYYSPNNNVNKDSFVRSTSTNTNKWLKIGGFIAASLGIIAIGIRLYKSKGIKSTDAQGIINKLTGKTVLSVKQKSIFESQMSQFASDIDYRKALLRGIGKQVGLDESDYAVLRPILGQEELTSTIKAFNGEEKFYRQGKRAQKWVQDTESTENIDNLVYRANLHIHTTKSDGKFKVQELLDDAAEYADKVAKKIETEPSLPANNAPYTIAICDHDTAEGCKQAVEIIARNPEKYKNLRVVLGSELSTYHRGITEINEGHRTHLLTYFHNPFDSDFARMLTEKQQKTHQTAQQIINRAQSTFGDFLRFRNITYNLDEAKAVSWCVRDGSNAINNPVKDYFQFRIVFHERITHNKPLKRFLESKSIDINDFKFEDSAQNVTYIHKILTKGKDMPYWDKYIISLKWEVLKKLHGKDFQLTPENFERSLKEVDLFEELPENITNTLHRIGGFVDGIELKETDQIFEFGDVVRRISQNKQGIMGIAHPGMSARWHYRNNPPSIEDQKNFIRNLFVDFKRNGQESAVFYEGVYPYFNDGLYLGTDDAFLDFINQAGRAQGLIPSGSLDNHGRNLFFTERMDKFVYP